MTIGDARVTLVTVGLGSARWKAAAWRLARQARATGWFDKVTAYDSESLVQEHPKFWADHGDFVKANPRGYGYWLWRPFLIREALTSGSADVVVFLDAGCEINGADVAGRRFLIYRDLARARGLFAMHTDLPLAHWCKGDLLEQTGLRDRAMDLRTVEPGVSLYCPTDSTLALVDDWIELATRDSYHLLDDSPSRSPDPDGFVEHRHDQAILTCVVADLPECVIPQESSFPGRWTADGAAFPFWVTRNRWPMQIGQGGAWSRLVHEVRRRRSVGGEGREW